MFFENAPHSRIDTKGLQEPGAHHRGRVHAEDISDLKSAQFFRQTSAWGKILVMAREGEIIRLRRIPDRRIFFRRSEKKNWRNFFFVFSNVKQSRLTSSLSSSSSSSAPATFVPNDKITNKNLSLEQGYLFNLT